MKRSDSGGEGSSSKRVRDDDHGRRRESQEDSSSPGSAHSGQYSSRGRGYHSSGEGRDREGRDRHERSGGNGSGYPRDREVEQLRRDLEDSSSPGGSRRDSYGDRGGRPSFDRRDGNGGDRGGRPPFHRRDSNGGGDRGGRPPFQRQDSNGGSDDGRRDFDRGGRGGGRPPFTGRGGPSDSRGGRGGRGRGGRGRGARRDRRAEELERHDLVMSRKGDSGGKSGTKGTEVKLLTNYFVVKKRPDWCIFHYRVDFEPDEERTHIKKQLLRPHRESLPAHIFDGSSLYVISEISSELCVLYSYGADPSLRIQISMRKVGEVTPTDVMHIQVLNIILRSCLSRMGMEEMGRNFYDASLAKTLPTQRLQLWPGYKTTIRPHENDVLLGVEMTNKVLRLDSCLDIIKSNLHHRDMHRVVGKEIVGSIVMTHYNRKTYRIDDIDWNKNPDDTFDSEGKSLSFADYMQQKYNIAVHDRHQPLLVSRPKKREMHRGMTGPILLIPELCQMTGLTDSMRENHQFMLEVNKHLHMEPQERVDAINNFMAKLTSIDTIKAEQEKWGLRFSTSLISVKGRILAQEPILLGRDLKVPGGDWTNSMKDNHMKVTVNLVDWVIIVPSRERQNAEQIVATLRRVGGNQNFRISEPKETKYIQNSYAQDYFHAIGEAVSTHKDLQMIFVVLINQRLDTYSAIKKRTYVDFGIPSQCFLVKHVKRNLMSVCTKTVIQMNAKLGGQPWHVGALPPGIMIVGFDVFHCGKRKGESMGATVASTNPSCSRFYSTVSAHKGKDELSNSLCSDISKCLHVYKLTNDKLPDKIVMYRDGVGEGQLGYVYNTELEQIKAAIRCVYGEGTPEPKIAFIVVTKKINTRIFANERGRFTNPTPGTLVDSVITLPERYDFFLISQSVKQGTVSPTSYNVLEDTIKYPPDRMQKLTFMMTHMYYNASATVAVPAPCQYAHKLAYLSGNVLKCASDEKLSDRLYYL